MDSPGGHRLRPAKDGVETTQSRGRDHGPACGRAVDRRGGGEEAAPAMKGRLALGGAVMVLLLLAPAARAATITVNSTADTTGGLPCTLRDAINAANTNAIAGGCPHGDAG